MFFFSYASKPLPSEHLKFFSLNKCSACVQDNLLFSRGHTLEQMYEPAVTMEHSILLFKDTMEQSAKGKTTKQKRNGEDIFPGLKHYSTENVSFFKSVLKLTTCGFFSFPLGRIGLTLHKVDKRLKCSFNSSLILKGL